jgi:hypothetical protein
MNDEGDCREIGFPQSYFTCENKEVYPTTKRNKIEEKI